MNHWLNKFNGWVSCDKKLPPIGETVEIKGGRHEGVGYISPFNNLWQDLTSNAMTTDFSVGIAVEYWREQGFKPLNINKAYGNLFLNPAHFDWKRPYKEYDGGWLLSLNKNDYNLMVEDTSFRMYSPLPKQEVKVAWSVSKSSNGSTAESGRCGDMEDGRILCQNAYLKLIGKSNKKQSHTISNYK